MSDPDENDKRPRSRQVRVLNEQLDIIAELARLHDREDGDMLRVVIARGIQALASGEAIQSKAAGE